MTKIVILTGAGVSAESGLGTFRDVGGLWDEYDLEEVATPQGYARDPDLVHRFYNARRANCLAAAPNAAHSALAQLEADFAGDVILVTQNIDNLHERAGHDRVHHMHGELLQALCASCDHRWPSPVEMSPRTVCPRCGAAAARPNVVWFGEMPYGMDEILTHVTEADLFVSIGTSGTVYPAAGFVAEAASHGARTLELNLDPADTSSFFDESRTGPATELVPAWVASLL